MGEYKGMSTKTLARHRPHLTTDEQVKDIEHINKKCKEMCSKEYCRSNAGKKRKTSKLTTNELLLNNPDTEIRQTTKSKHVSQYLGLLTTFKVTSIEELLEAFSKEEIKGTIMEKYADPLRYLGLVWLIIMDLKPHLNKDGLAEYLKDEKTTARDEASLKANKKREEDNTDYQALYDKLMARTPPTRIMENLIFLLYTKGYQRQEWQADDGSAELFQRGADRGDQLPDQQDRELLRHEREPTHHQRPQDEHRLQVLQLRSPK
eukprot:6174566-Pleurochrysis_carterae.AAC.1